MTLVDQAGANPVTINILSTGLVDVASIAAWVAAKSVTTIRVSQIYDQTGNGNHWSNATLATMPTLTLNALNGLPVLNAVAASNTSLQAASGLASAVLEPLVLMSVYKKTGAAAVSAAMGFNSSDLCLGSDATANTALLRANTGAGFNTTATDGQFNAVLGLINGASPASVINVSGTETAGTTSTSGIPIGATPRIMRGNGGGTMDGSWAEGGLLFTGANLNSAQRGAVVANARSRYAI
nr:hypothetical protein [uncultured Bradyrhizobium sp.]